MTIWDHTHLIFLFCMLLDYSLCRWSFIWNGTINYLAQKAIWDQVFLICVCTQQVTKEKILGDTCNVFSGSQPIWSVCSLEGTHCLFCSNGRMRTSCFLETPIVFWMLDWMLPMYCKILFRWFKYKVLQNKQPALWPPHPHTHTQII